MKTYIINLRRREDRRRRMDRLLPSQLEAEFTSSWNGPFDGQKITLDTLDGYELFPWQIESHNEWWNRPLKKGEIGCAISHLECWKHAFQYNFEKILILEDDIDFGREWWKRLEQGLEKLATHAINWDLLYLGYEPLDVAQKVIDDIVKPPYSYGTYAYLLTRARIEKLLQTSFEKHIIPVDEFLSAMYTDHPREDVRKIYKKCLAAFASDPALITPFEPFIDDSDTENSLYLG